MEVGGRDDGWVDGEGCGGPRDSVAVEGGRVEWKGPVEVW